MKICHITTVHPRYDVRIFWKECVSIAKAGNEVILIVNDNLGEEVINGVKIVSINSTYTNRLTRILSRALKQRTFKKAKETDADIFHFHDPELLGVGIKLVKYGSCVIYDSHEDVPRQILAKEWMPAFIRKIVSKLFEIYENKCTRKFNAIIVPTPHIKDRFLKLNNNVCEICNYPSVDEITYSGQNYSISNPDCTVGNLSNTRGKRQFAKITNKNIILNYKNCKDWGYISRNDISNILCNSSIGFVTLLDTPNDSLSYPIKLFEYMAAGIPVISSNFPVYKELVEGNNCGLCIDPLDVDEMCTAIEQIRRDIGYANKLRENGRKAIVERYNWESQSERLLACYSEVLL